MTDVHGVDAALGEWLNQQQLLARTLLDSQAQLGNALRSGLSVQIEQESRTQAELISSLNAGRQTLAALLRQAGHSDDGGGIAAAIDAADIFHRERLRLAWDELRGDLRRIRENNRRSTLLAGHQQKAIMDSLLQLSGHARQQVSAYSAKGQRTSAPRSRVIGQA